jgi:hypothetical protein
MYSFSLFLQLMKKKNLSLIPKTKPTWRLQDLEIQNARLPLLDRHSTCRRVGEEALEGGRARKNPEQQCCIHLHALYGVFFSLPC